MPISRKEFDKIPDLPKGLQSKLALQIHEALLSGPLALDDLARTVAKSTEDVESILNRLVRSGFVGFSRGRYHWAQTTKGQPALRNE